MLWQPGNRAILSALLVSCVASSPAPNAHPLCAPVSEREPFDHSQPTALAGDFDLVVVWDEGLDRPVSRSGHLHLELSDTRFRYHMQSPVTGQWRRRVGGERPLWGWTEAGFEPPQEAGSQDPQAPGVYYDTEAAALYVGVRPRVTDDGFDLLQITWTARGGFGGSFVPNLGLAVVFDKLTKREVPQSGYFCAQRRDA